MRRACHVAPRAVRRGTHRWYDLLDHTRHLAAQPRSLRLSPLTSHLELAQLGREHINLVHELVELLWRRRRGWHWRHAGRPAGRAAPFAPFGVREPPLLGMNWCTFHVTPRGRRGTANRIERQSAHAFVDLGDVGLQLGEHRQHGGRRWIGRRGVSTRCGGLRGGGGWVSGGWLRRA